MLKALVKSSLTANLTRRVTAAIAAPREFEEASFPKLLAKRVAELATERGLDDRQKHDLLFEIGRELLPNFSINDIGRVFLQDQNFRAEYERRLGTFGNWKNYERRWTIEQLLRLIANVPGDLAECGVLEGASASQLCRAATKHGREVHLFDSFEGLSDPGADDGAFWQAGGLSASLQTVGQNLSEFDCVTMFPGWIPARFPDVENNRYAFVHIDVDLEQPTRDSISFFYPRMNPSGIILLDDHGYDTCPGARKAALEVMADKREPVLDLATGQGLIIISRDERG